jgi:hypothetical protein
MIVATGLAAAGYQYGFLFHSFLYHFLSIFVCSQYG